MSLDEEVSRTELSELLKYFSKYPYRARDTNPKVRSFTNEINLADAYVINFYRRVSCDRLIPLLSFQVEGIQKKCLQLFAKDYKFTVRLLNCPMLK